MGISSVDPDSKIYDNTLFNLVSGRNYFVKKDNFLAR